MLCEFFTSFLAFLRFLCETVSKINIFEIEKRIILRTLRMKNILWKDFYRFCIYVRKKVCEEGQHFFRQINVFTKCRSSQCKKQCSVKNREIYSHWKIFRQSNNLVISLVNAKFLLKKHKSVNFLDFHWVEKYYKTRLRSKISVKSTL